MIWMVVVAYLIVLIGFIRLMWIIVDNAASDGAEKPTKQKNKVEKPKEDEDRIRFHCIEENIDNEISFGY